MVASSQTPLLEVKNLVIEFRTERGVVRAVDDVSFDLYPGETLGIVGESGCGKSVTSLSILGLIPSPPGKIVSGSIRYAGRELIGLPECEYQKIRGQEISMIFQDPMTALNPVLRVGDQMSDVIRQHQKISKSQARKRAIEMLEVVGIPSPDKRIDEYPHQLSGGMRQRIMIAMALSCGPKILLADEPTTALDVTTQAQVLAEMARLQKHFQMSMVLVTHDLGVIAETCHRVLVMYCGQLVEASDVKTIFARPRHPYTRGLLDSIPRIRAHKLDRLPVIKGMVPDLLHLPNGCRFADRCELVQEKCHQREPRLSPAAQEESRVACFYPLSGGHNS